MKPVTAIFTVFMILYLPRVVAAQAVLGARSVALGQAATALPSSGWALFANPAAMDTADRTVSFFGFRYYGFSEITDMAVAANYPSRIGVLGFGMHRYGFELFRENRIRIAYQNGFENFRYGAVLNYQHLTQGGGYGSAGALGVDLGIAAILLDRIRIAARATNVNQPAYGKGTASEPLPRELAVGLSYRLPGRALIVGEVVKDVRFPASFRGGVETTLFGTFSARAGVTTEPTTFAGGFGYSTGFWKINVAAQNHQELGVSPGFDLGIRW